MRRLARELDTGPASLYVYVRNSAELHGAMLDHLLDDIDLDGRAEAGESAWRRQLVALLEAYTGLLLRHPGLARSVQVLRPSGPNYLRLVEAALGLLRAGGVPVRNAAWGIDILLQHATATAVEQSTRQDSDDAMDQAEELVNAVQNTTASGAPNIAWAHHELFSGTGPQRLRWAFELLLDGLTAAGRRATLGPPSGPAPT